MLTYLRRAASIGTGIAKFKCKRVKSQLSVRVGIIDNIGKNITGGSENEKGNDPAFYRQRRG